MRKQKSALETLKEFYGEFRDYFEIDPDEVNVDMIETSPLYASNFKELLEALTEVKDVVSADPYFDYPFKPADNVLEYVACMNHDWKLCDEVPILSYFTLGWQDKEYLYKLLGAYLGHKYVLYLTEGGDGQFDLILLGDSPELFEKARKLAEILEQLEKMYPLDEMEQEEIVQLVKRELRKHM